MKVIVISLGFLFSILISVRGLGPDSHSIVTSTGHHELSGLVEHETLHSILVSDQGSDLQFESFNELTITNEMIP